MRSTPHHRNAVTAWALALAFALAAPALLRAEAPAAGRDEAKDARPFLWKIDGAPPSYLFGTIHIGRREVTELPPAVRDAHGRADAVYTEIAMDPAGLIAISSKTLLDGDQTLSKILPPDVLESARQTLRAINPSLRLAPLDRMKVWAFATTICLLEEKMKSPGPALDILLYQRAAAAGKEVGGLETGEEQLAVFDSFSIDEQILMLRETLDYLRQLRAKGVSFVDELAAIYRTGNLDAIAAVMNEWMTVGDPALAQRFIKRLLDDRSERMAARIADKLRAHPGKAVFFAVGAAHLYGPRGVIALLEKEGFKLERAAAAPAH